LDRSKDLFTIDVNDSVSSQVIDLTLKPSFWDSLLGKGSVRKHFLISINSKDIHEGFFDINGNEFQTSAIRVLGHELGHALVKAVPGLPSDPHWAIHIENAIARQLNSNAVLRHPTKGHSNTFADLGR
jgi:hypothetical protein